MGTNPISFIAPGNSGDNFALDMATTTVALGKIEVANRKNVEMPTGWGTDRNGDVTNGLI